MRQHLAKSVRIKCTHYILIGVKLRISSKTVDLILAVTTWTKFALALHYLRKKLIMIRIMSQMSRHIRNRNRNN
jgi:hypothetical protein